MEGANRVAIPPEAISVPELNALGAKVVGNETRTRDFVTSTRGGCVARHTLDARTYDSPCRMTFIRGDKTHFHRRGRQLGGERGEGEACVYARPTVAADETRKTDPRDYAVL